MRRYFQITFLMFLSAVLVTQFQNCDVYSEDTGLFNQFASTCVGNDCNTEDPRAEYLKLRANYPNPLYVLGNADYINIGGDCNEGGFPDNIIQWKLFGDNSIMSSSEDPGQQRGKCVNGRFSVRVKVSYVYGGVTYYGLEIPDQGTPGVLDYKDRLLEIELFGKDENGNVIENPGAAPESIWLVPISFQN